MAISGVWLPIITPFKNFSVDYESLKRLVDHYCSTGISGLIVLGTTGEVCTVDDDEYCKIVDFVVSTTRSRLPIYVGAGGNATHKVIKTINSLENCGIQGVLSVCPYYNRPSQQGLFEHFKAISEASSLDIILYNIPIRTGVNMSNETLFRLAEMKNIVGVKDCCNSDNQTFELLKGRPIGFSVLAGDDSAFYNALVNGADGGITASAHLATTRWVNLFQNIKKNSLQEALKIWSDLYEIASTLFLEPNPGPLKFCLKQLKMIDSEELRLPMTPPSSQLKEKLSQLLGTIPLGNN